MVEGVWLRDSRKRVQYEQKNDRTRCRAPVGRGILALALWSIAPHSMAGPEIAIDRDQAQVD